MTEEGAEGQPNSCQLVQGSGRWWLPQAPTAIISVAPQSRQHLIQNKSQV